MGALTRRERLIEGLKDRWEARRKHRPLRWVLGELKDPLDPIEILHRMSVPTKAK